jgi:predicted O-methyltransferase YrrM
MEPIDERLVERVDQYIESLFVPHDEMLCQNLRDAQAAGVPDINVSPVQGKLLYLLAKIAAVRRILEIGTLAGYSTTWLARALPPEGRVVTLEIDPRHAAVARMNLDRIGAGPLVDIRIGPAAESLHVLIESREEPFDLIFIDADKPGYPKYLRLSLQLSRRGTIILADNVIRNGRVLDETSGDANAQGVRAYNYAIAGNSQLDSVIIPMIREKLDGMAASVVK